jgi:hypothetical protein
MRFVIVVLSLLLVAKESACGGSNCAAVCAGQSTVYEPALGTGIPETSTNNREVGVYMKTSKPDEIEIGNQYTVISINMKNVYSLQYYGVAGTISSTPEQAGVIKMVINAATEEVYEFGGGFEFSAKIADLIGVKVTAEACYKKKSVNSTANSVELQGSACFAQEQRYYSQQQYGTVTLTGVVNIWKNTGPDMPDEFIELNDVSVSSPYPTYKTGSIKAGNLCRKCVSGS